MNSWGPFRATTPAFCTKDVCTRHGVAMHLFDLLDVRLWTGNVAQTPARHGIGLRQPVEYERPLGHARQSGDARVSLAVVEDLLVHLIREDEEITFCANAAIAASSPSSSTRPVGLFGELINRMRAGVQAAERFRRQSPVVVRIKGHGHGRAARQLHHWPVETQLAPGSSRRCRPRQRRASLRRALVSPRE